MFDWLRNINKSKVATPEHSLEPYLSDQVEFLTKEHIEKHISYFKINRNKNNKRDVIKLLEIHIESLDKYKTKSYHIFLDKKVNSYIKKISDIKEDILNSRYVNIVLQDIERKKEGRLNRINLKDLIFFNETKMFVISSSIELKRYTSTFGHPFTLYTISHFGYHYIQFIKLETLITKGEPDRIILQTSDGLENFQRYRKDPRILFTRELVEDGKEEWVHQFNHYMNFINS